MFRGVGDTPSCAFRFAWCNLSLSFASRTAAQRTKEELLGDVMLRAQIIARNGKHHACSSFVPPLRVTSCYCSVPERRFQPPKNISFSTSLMLVFRFSNTQPRVMKKVLKPERLVVGTIYFLKRMEKTPNVLSPQEETAGGKRRTDTRQKFYRHKQTKADGSINFPNSDHKKK